MENLAEQNWASCKASSVVTPEDPADLVPVRDGDATPESPAPSPQPSPTTPPPATPAKPIGFGGGEVAAYPPPFWTSTKTFATAFVGVVPYESPGRLDALESPLMASSDDCEMYVGTCADLRDRVGLMQATLDFEGDRMIRKHRDHRKLVASYDEAEYKILKTADRLLDAVDDKMQLILYMKKFKFSCNDI